MKCPTCDQYLHSKPVYQDALGRAFKAGNVLLLKLQVNTFKADGLSITCNARPLGYDTVMVVPNRFEVDGPKWTMHARGLDSSHIFIVEGFCGQMHDRIYKLADNIRGLPNHA